MTGDLDVGGSDGDANMYSHCPWEVNQGLGKYEAAFRVNDIDQTVLPNLTAPRSGRRIGPPLDELLAFSESSDIPNVKTAFASGDQLALGLDSRCCRVSLLSGIGYPESRTVSFAEVR